MRLDRTSPGSIPVKSGVRWWGCRVAVNELFTARACPHDPPMRTNLTFIFFFEAHPALTQPSAALRGGEKKSSGIGKNASGPITYIDSGTGTSFLSSPNAHLTAGTAQKQLPEPCQGPRGRAAAADREHVLRREKKRQPHRPHSHGDRTCVGCITRVRGWLGQNKY